MNLSNKTVEWLRKNNYKVKIHHYRFRKDEDTLFSIKDIPDFTMISGKGGKTQVFITTPDKKELYGEAKCNIKDSFNYKLGVKISLGRLKEITN